MLDTKLQLHVLCQKFSNTQIFDTLSKIKSLSRSKEGTFVIYLFLNSLSVSQPIWWVVSSLVSVSTVLNSLTLSQLVGGVFIMYQLDHVPGKD